MIQVYIPMPDFNLDIPASSNPKCLRLWPSGSWCTHGIHGRLMGGACACMYLLQAVFFLSSYEEIVNSQCWNSISSKSQIPNSRQSATIDICLCHISIVLQTSPSLLREWMLVNTARKTKTQVGEEWKKAIANLISLW